MIIAKDLHKIYRTGAKEVRAVNGIDLEIKDGVSAAITGPSGAGKSTLLHLLGGLDNPTRGSVSLDGVDIYKLSDGARAKIRNERVGFVFQFYHLLPEFTALENVMLPALIRKDKRNAKETRQRALALLERVGLKERMGHFPSELSGGEQQRAAIARSLMNDPEILFCDEPTGNLDQKMGQGIAELLRDLYTKERKTVLVVTHDERIAKMAHRVWSIVDRDWAKPQSN